MPDHTDIVFDPHVALALLLVFVAMMLVFVVVMAPPVDDGRKIRKE